MKGNKKNLFQRYLKTYQVVSEKSQKSSQTSTIVAAGADL